MISDEQIQQLAADAGLPLGVRDQHETSLGLLARAIEREAIAEPVRLMREWREAKAKLISALNDNLSTDADCEAASTALMKSEWAIRDYLDKMK